jgi:hypothetical protein
MNSNETNTRRDAKARLLNRREIDDNGCWHYKGASASNGYGWMSYRGKSEYAHRVAAIVFLDYDPTSGLCVCHRCDIPDCFNPLHLFIATQQENMSDAASKGRMGGKKLTATDAGTIKYLLRTGRTQRSIAIDYGVSVTTIGQIARGETWRDVQEASPELDDQPESDT